MIGYRENEFPAPEPLTPEQRAYYEKLVAALAENSASRLRRVQYHVYMCWMFDGVEAELLILGD